MRRAASSPAVPFVTVNWAEGLDDSGRPVETPQPPGAPTFPGVQGGTNWYSPSFSPRTGLFYVPAWEDYASVFDGQPQVYEPGRSFIGGRPRTAAPVTDAPTVPGLTRGPINTPGPTRRGPERWSRSTR